MSDFTAIRATSLSLQALLQATITDSTEPQLAGVPIDLRSPRELRELQLAQTVSLWLYRVTRNPDLLNRQPRRVTSSRLASIPLPLDLRYLVTPLSDDAATRHALLGRVLQVFNDHAVLRGADLQDSLTGQPDELRLVLEGLGQDEISRIWEALQEPYDLSCSYLVQLIAIDSDLELVEAGPVLTPQTRVSQIVSSA